MKNKRQIRENRKIENEEAVSELCALYGCEIQAFTDIHFRVNGRLDYWPTTKKYYDRKTGRKGAYDELVIFVPKFLNLQKTEYEI